MAQRTAPDTQGGIKRHSNIEKTRKSISRKNYCKDGIYSFSLWRWTSNALVLGGSSLEVHASLSYLSILILCKIFQFQEKSVPCECLSLDFSRQNRFPAWYFANFVIGSSVDLRM